MIATLPEGQPNITFTIEKTNGAVLATYNTGNIPEINPATWVKYGFNFTTPAGVSTVVIRMRNNAPGNLGNDLALDDIAFTPLGPQTTIGVAGNNDDVIRTTCGNNTSFTSAVAACYVATSYQWQISPMLAHACRVCLTQRSDNVCN
jgi:hypothetical protein